MKTKTKIALADDEILIRTGIRAVLEQHDNFEIICEASNGQELLDFMKDSINVPDIILMDIRMPQLNGLEATKFIVKNYPDIKIIALSSYNSAVFISNMIDIGAVCYLSKNSRPKVIIDSINLVIKNGFYFEESILELIENNVRKTKTIFDKNFFTKREKEVLRLICEQYNATEISEKLQISARTVDGFRNSLLFKTDSKNIIGLVIFAVQNNFYSFDEHFLKKE
jgi:DNA-binding NarL/FixJ family response regulator